MSGDSPAVARRRLRLALRKAREAKNLTQAQVAHALDWSLSKVNRIEAGEVTVSSTDLRALLALLGVSDTTLAAQMLEDARTARRRGWWDQPKHRQHLNPATMQFLQFETEATTARVFQPTMVPGLLQTPGYAAFVLGVWGNELSEADRAVRYEVRMRRRDQVFGRTDPLQYLLILDESVLSREIGGPEVMAAQLDQLIVAASEPNVTVRVVPLAQAAPIAMLGPFTILDLGDEEDAVLYREKYLLDEIIHAEDTIQWHRMIFEQMWDRALPEDATRRMIEARRAMLLSSLDQRSATE